MRSRDLEMLKNAYPDIAASMLRPAIKVFSAAHQVCNGDLEKFLILLVIGVRTTEHPDFRRLRHQEIIAGVPPVLPSLGTNMRSIAASVALPRETTRRKLMTLERAGWLSRDGNDYRLTAQGYATLEPVRHCFRGLALEHHRIVEQVLGCPPDLTSSEDAVRLSL